MKKKFLLFAFLLSYLLAFSQMPTDGSYSNWNWENSSQDNWRSLHGNIWTDIRPPFEASTPRVGTMSKVKEVNDYTKAKGWYLVWAQFNGPYPWFALYNSHKAILRVFFYLEDIPFTQVLATLKYSDVNNPSLLSFGKEYQWSNEAYYNNLANSDKDLIAVVIPNIAPQCWGAADFPIMYDKYITDSKYLNKKWEFKFFGCDNNTITLAGQSTNDPRKGTTDPTQSEQHTLIAKQSSFTINSLVADQAKLQKEIESVGGFIKSMKDAANKTDTTIGFLKSYKKAVNSFAVKDISDLFSFASSLSSGAGAILGFVKLISGSFDESTTKPVAVTEYLNLQGSMTISKTLGYNTISIPGLSSPYFPPLNELKWTPFNCPMGIISLEKTPKIKVTTAYEKYGSFTPVYYFINGTTNCIQIGTSTYSPSKPTFSVDGSHPLLSGYPGKVKKYKFDDDITLAQQKISGLNMIDVNFAIVCKANGIGDRKYSIKDRYMAYYTFYNLFGSAFSDPLENPVYKALEDERFIVHKFDEDKDEVYFGTPYMSKNKLKGVVFEVPEDTEVKLAVYVKYSSDKFSDPIIFKAVYNMAEVQETAQMSRIVYTQEQTNFKYSEYYNSPLYIGLTTSYNIEKTACVVEMLPGFVGNTGFIANSLPFFSGIEIGNTIINETDFNCVSSQQYNALYMATKEKKNEISGENIINESKPTLYPNPTNGVLTISNPTKDEIEEVSVYTSTGQVMIRMNSVEILSNQFNISQLPVGVYFVNLRSASKIYTVPIILKK